MAQPPKHRIYIVRGDTWSQTWRYKDASGNAIDLSDYTALLQIRQTPDDKNTYLSLPADGTLTTDANGDIVATVAPTVTTLLGFTFAVYDLQITSSGGIVTTIIRGDVKLIEDVSK
jgi:hypothetical protein